MIPLPFPARLGSSALRASRVSLAGLALLSAPFLKVVPPKDPRRRNRVYTPELVFWLCVRGCLAALSTCREAVLGLRAEYAVRGLDLPSVSTSAFCRAKRKLPLPWLEGLSGKIAAALESDAVKSWRWLGHTVKVIDGTTLSLADTPANQARWPQSQSQKPGCGFPTMRLVGVFSLATGALLARAIGPLATGERALFTAGLLPSLAKGDIVLQDRGLSGYGMAALLFTRGIQVVTRIHQRLSVSITTVRRNAPGDRIVRWVKPAKPTGKFTGEEWDALPAFIEARVITVRIDIPGCRTPNYTILTTLLGHKRYPAADLAELYRRRWLAELCFRHIKTTMGFGELRALSPEMVLRELALDLVAYNLLRCLMATAAAAHRTDPSALSLAATIQALRQFAQSPGRGSRFIQALLQTIADCRLRHRPGRTEPRAVKRRGKGYPLLNKHRREMIDIPHRSRYSSPKKRAAKPRRRTTPLPHEQPAVIVRAA